MKVYTIYKSEDGLNFDAATNGKALYELILATNYNQIDTIEGWNRDSNKFFGIPFNYPNLLKAIRYSKGGSAEYLVTFNCIGADGELRIQEVNLHS